MNSKAAGATASIANAIADSYREQVSIYFPDTGQEPFSIVRFRPAKAGAVSIDVMINFDLTYQIEAGRFVMHESSEPGTSAEVVKAVTEEVLRIAGSGLRVTRRWPMMGKFSPTAIGEAASTVAQWRFSKANESWLPWD